MPSVSEINHQLELLKLYRRNVATLLKQKALNGGNATCPIHILNAIDDNRNEIRRIKYILRNWEVRIEDHPDDEADDVALTLLIRGEREKALSVDRSSLLMKMSKELNLSIEDIEVTYVRSGSVLLGLGLPKSGAIRLFRDFTYIMSYFRRIGVEQIQLDLRDTLIIPVAQISSTDIDIIEDSLQSLKRSARHNGWPMNIRGRIDDILDLAKVARPLVLAVDVVLPINSILYPIVEEIRGLLLELAVILIDYLY